jgi:hypothetical protein
VRAASCGVSKGGRSPVERGESEGGSGGSMTSCGWGSAARFCGSSGRATLTASAGVADGVGPGGFDAISVQSR